MKFSSAIPSRAAFCRLKFRPSGWLAAFCLCAAFVPDQAEKKSGECCPPNGPKEGIELSAQARRYIEVAVIGPQTNGVWGRSIPARVSLQTSARINVGALVEGRVEEVM